MAEEFTINSANIETKINQLLPSQGGFAPGVDFSASTMIIPIVDLTETAQGSVLRQDLQTAIRFNTTVFNISNANNTVIVNTTGYWRLVGLFGITETGDSGNCNVNLFDGTTEKIVLNGFAATKLTSDGFVRPMFFDLIFKMSAGESIRGSAKSNTRLSGSATQIADINGNLT